MRPVATGLQPVEAGLSWLTWREAAERPVSGYFEDELRGYLACRLLCYCFALTV
jgi:hypothetical protein